MLVFRRTIVLVQHLVLSLSLGDYSVHRLREDCTPTHTHTHTLQKPHIHTPTHYKNHTYTHPHITKPTHTHTHTLQNPHMHTHTPIIKPTHTHIHTLHISKFMRASCPPRHSNVINWHNLCFFPNLLSCLRLRNKCSPQRAVLRHPQFNHMAWMFVRNERITT